MPTKHYCTATDDREIPHQDNQDAQNGRDAHPPTPARQDAHVTDQGHSERRGEAYSVLYVEPLSDARTPLADFFSILLGNVCIALTAGRVEHGLLHRQGLAWNAVLFHGPCAQVSDLATF